MTEQAKRTRQKNDRSAKARAVRRDAYDAFLDMTEEKTASKGTKAKTAASKKTTSASVKRSTNKVKIQPGLGMEDDWNARPNGKKKVSAKTTSVKKTRSASRTAKPAHSENFEMQARSGRPKTAPSATVRSKTRRQAVLAVDNVRDAYDELLEEWDAPPRRKSPKRRGSAGVTAVLTAGIVCMAALGLWQTAQYRSFQTMKRAVEQQSFYEGTTIDGVDVSGMTLDAALDYWNTQIEPAYAQRTVTLSNGAAFTAAELGYSSDYETVLANAWSAGRSGSLEERYAMLSSRRESPVSYTVTRRAYSDEAVAQCVAAIAEAIDRPAEDAKIEAFDLETYTFSFSEETTGSRLDTQALTEDMTQALQSGDGEVQLIVNAIQPSVTREEVSSQYGLVTTAVTNASSSSSNRLSNIRLALELIHGTCLKPGETFSFNETVGKRTTDRGFKVATAYSSGAVTEDVGGGICQVSTTLFNAAVKADLEIVERHNHSLTVGYVDKGKDAAVNWDTQDLRFTNTSGDDLYICCALSSDKRVRIGIYGKLLPNGESIVVEGETTETIAYETVYQPNLAMASGTMQVVQNGKNGCKAVAYKVRLDANGNQISRELLCSSTYRSISEIIEYGP